MTSSRVHLPGVGQSLAENFSLSCLEFLSLWESLWTFLSHKECFRIFQNLLRNLPEFLCKRDYVFGSKEGDSTKSIISLVTPRSWYQCWRPGGVRRCERAEVWSTPTEWSLTANATTLTHTLNAHQDCEVRGRRLVLVLVLVLHSPHSHAHSEVRHCQDNQDIVSMLDWGQEAWWPTIGGTVHQSKANGVQIYLASCEPL